MLPRCVIREKGADIRPCVDHLSALGLSVDNEEDGWMVKGMPGKVAAITS